MCMICFTEALSAAPAIQVQTRLFGPWVLNRFPNTSTIFFFVLFSWIALMYSTFSALVVFWKIVGLGLGLLLVLCSVLFAR